MADKKEVPKPAEPPKPVHIGGESLVDRIIPHIKKIVIAVIVVAVVVSVYLFIRYLRHRGDEQDTEKMVAVMSVAQRPVQVEGATPDPANPAFATDKDRALAVLAEIAKQDSDLITASYRGGLLLDAGKLDEAITEYRRGEAGAGIEGVLAREGLGIALEAKAAVEKDAAARQRLYQDALKAFTAMQPDAKGPRHAYALYHQARVQLLLGKAAEARALFEKARTAAEGTDLVELIQKRLGAMGAS